MAHTCHARDCTTPTSRSKFMCGYHWSLVPQLIRFQVIDHYTAGQCEGAVRPTQEWLEAARRAINAVHAQEKDAAKPTVVMAEIPCIAEDW